MTIDAGPEELYTTPARAADVPALLRLVNGAYRGDAGRRGWTAETELVAGPRIDAAALAEMLAAPDQALLVLRAESGLFACAEVTRLGDGIAAIGLLAVRPALQGSGIGRRMLAAAERHARERYRARAVEIAVIPDREELIAWTERRGYQPTGETRPLPDDERYGVPTRPGLSFAVLRRSLAS